MITLLSNYSWYHKNQFGESKIIGSCGNYFEFELFKNFISGRLFYLDSWIVTMFHIKLIHFVHPSSFLPWFSAISSVNIHVLLISIPMFPKWLFNFRRVCALKKLTMLARQQPPLKPYATIELLYIIFFAALIIIVHSL